MTFVSHTWCAVPSLFRPDGSHHEDFEQYSNPLKITKAASSNLTADL